MRGQRERYHASERKQMKGSSNCAKKTNAGEEERVHVEVGGGGGGGGGGGREIRGGG